MKTFETMEHKERTEITELFANWLKSYTHEVIVKVMEKKDEIINNEFAMTMLKELKEREEMEEREFNSRMYYLLENLDCYKEFDTHNNALTHADSYRNVLYDMYIRNK